MNVTKSRRPSAVLKLASAAILAALAGGVWAQTTGGASTIQSAGARLADLETAFWVCEYAATTRGNANVENCAAIYSALKERKFGGDFEELLKWWQQNRESVFRRIATSEVALAGDR